MTINHCFYFHKAQSVCDSNQLQCENRGDQSTFCIPQSYVCDGYDDNCKDFKDESPVRCATGM